MFDQKEANYYQNYIPDLQGGKITVLPTMDFSIDYSAIKNTPYIVAEKFMKRAERPSKMSYLDDFFNQKKELSEDKVNLVCIPTNPDTDSKNFRTPIPIRFGHLFQSKADTPRSERSDAGKLVNVRRYFSILLSI